MGSSAATTTTPLPARSRGPVDVPAIMDIEASGFGRNSYPIEVGYVLADGSSFCTLIQPLPHWTHWDPAAERVHRIGRDVLQLHGRGVVEVADLLNKQLRGCTLFSDGWAHDYAWLGALFEEAGRQPSFRLDSLRKLLSESDTMAWDAVKQQVGEEMSLPRHRASTDARLLQQTWLRLNTAVTATPD